MHEFVAVAEWWGATCPRGAHGPSPTRYSVWRSGLIEASQLPAAGMGTEPRAHLAMERTLAAWLRAALFFMALGFLVARFGLLTTLMYAEEVVPQVFPPPLLSATTLGIVLVLAGLVLALTAAIDYRRAVRTQAAGALPPAEPRSTPLLAAALVMATGAVLAAYLWASG